MELPLLPTLRFWLNMNGTVDYSLKVKNQSSIHTANRDTNIIIIVGKSIRVPSGEEALGTWLEVKASGRMLRKSFDFV